MIGEILIKIREGALWCAKHVAAPCLMLLLYDYTKNRTNEAESVKDFKIRLENVKDFKIHIENEEHFQELLLKSISKVNKTLGVINYRLDLLQKQQKEIKANEEKKNNS